MVWWGEHWVQKVVDHLQVAVILLTKDILQKGPALGLIPSGVPLLNQCHPLLKYLKMFEDIPDHSTVAALSE